MHGIGDTAHKQKGRVAGIGYIRREKMREMLGMSYTHGMTNSNVSQLRPDDNPQRVARAKHVHGLLTDERWSVRKAAMAIGMSTSALSERMSGKTSFLAEDLEAVAKLLKRDPVDFYREYLAVPTEFDPAPSAASVGRTGLEPVTDGL